MLIFPRDASLAHVSGTWAPAHRQQGCIRLVSEMDVVKQWLNLLACPFSVSTSPVRRGWKGLIAYGCQSVVVVIEPRTVQPLQTLAHHRSNVVRVCRMYMFTRVYL